MQQELDDAKRQRPDIITVIAILIGLNGLGNIISIALLYPSHYPGINSGNIMNFLLGAAALLLAYGLWTLRKWAFWSVAIIALLNLLSSALAFLTGTFRTDVIISLLLYLIVVTYLFKNRQAKEAFGVVIEESI
jgi:hypothetical protein